MCQPEKTETVDIPVLADKEIIEATERFANTKASGLDVIPNKAVKIAIKYNTGPFTLLYTQCLREGVFPKIWKMQRLVPLQKPNKPAGEPSSCRPLCIRDTMGKILERITCVRLEQHL